MTWTFSVAGESGGWSLAGMAADTVAEFQAAARAQLAAAGFTIDRLAWDIGDALGDRVTANRFPYRATLTVSHALINSTGGATDGVRWAFRTAANNEPAVSVTSAGDDAQPAPGTYAATIGDAAAGITRAATVPLMLLAAGLVAVAVIVAKEG